MKRTVAAFNALTGHDMSERDGWLFMATLKLARATAGALVPDDLIDAAAYCALALESETDTSPRPDPDSRIGGVEAS